MATIIVVDDSDTVRTQLRQALEKAGHVVIEGENGNDGFDKIVASNNPALVISDYNMPGADGVAMLKRVKEKLGKVSFPVFMLTTETSEKIIAAGKEVGVVAWINKPFDRDKLLEAISMVVK